MQISSRLLESMVLFPPASGFAEGIAMFFVSCLVTTQLLMSRLSLHYKHPGFVTCQRLQAKRQCRGP